MMSSMDCIAPTVWRPVENRDYPEHLAVCPAPGGLEAHLISMEYAGQGSQSPSQGSCVVKGTQAGLRAEPARAPFPLAWP